MVQQQCQDLAFVLDMSDLLHKQNRMLQGLNKYVTQYYDYISLHVQILLCGRHIYQTTSLISSHVNKIFVLLYVLRTLVIARENYHFILQFDWRFHVLDELETKFKIFCSLLSIMPSDVPSDMHFEMIHLLCDSKLKENLAYVCHDVHEYLLPGYLKLRDLAAKILLMFGTTYLCEHVFSLMSIKKYRLCSNLMNKDL